MNVLKHPLVLAPLATLIVVFTFSIGVRVSTPYPEAATIGRDAPTFKVLSTRFEMLAKEKGGVYAFEVLKRAELPPNTDTHLLGHTVGDVLYTQKGLQGIADCTQDFRNACSHTIVVGALNEFGPGPDTQKKIDDACKAAPGGIGAYTMCYHGLGHGVLAFFGYDMAKTVAFCEQTGTAEYEYEQYPQCVSGAVMEILSGGAHDHDAWLAARAKYLKPDQPLAPCSSSVIPEVAKGFCYIYLTPRLFELAGMDIGRPDPELFPRAFSYCEAIPARSARLRDACFGGFGKEFLALAAYRDIRSIDRMDSGQYARVAGWCELAGEHDGTESCIRQALEAVFWGGENDPNAAFRFCAATGEDFTDGCYRDLSDIINHYLRGDARVRVCAQLPQMYQNRCTE